MSDESDRGTASEPDRPAAADGGTRAGGDTHPDPGADGATGPTPVDASGPPAGTAEVGDDERESAVVTTGDTTVIVRTVARITVPLVLLVAVSLTLRGHNLPGGGFIGGVTTAIAVEIGRASCRERVCLYV